MIFSAAGASGRGHDAAALAFAGGGAVGVPETSRFVADELVLPARWEESAWTPAPNLLASVLLAVATRAPFVRVSLAPPRRRPPPHLAVGARRSAMLLLLMLVALGFFPAELVSPVHA